MSDLQPIPDLEKYVDVDDALKRVCGNAGIYKKLLGKFRDGLQYDQLCGEIAEGDYETATRTAHSIKGVAANLSLKASYEMAMKIEEQLKGGSIDPQDLAEFGDILKKTVACAEYIEATI